MKKINFELLILIILFSFGCAGLSSQRTPGEVVSKYQELIRQNPNDAKAHYNLGVANANLLGRYQEAIVSLKEAIRINPNDEYSHYWLGVSYEEIGNIHEAIASYQEALRIDPGLKNTDRIKNLIESEIAQAKLSAPVRQRTPQPSVKQQVVAGGTGFLFSSRDYIITNYLMCP